MESELKDMTRIVEVTSSDGVVFKVARNVIAQSKLIDGLFKATLDYKDSTAEKRGDTEMKVPNVDAATLKKVIEWCEFHVDDPVQPETATAAEKRVHLTSWDCEFMKVTSKELYNIIQAGNYMDIPVLFTQSCMVVSMMLYGKTTDEIRRILNIIGDFTPEEEAAIRRENAWCED